MTVGVTEEKAESTDNDTSWVPAENPPEGVADVTIEAGHAAMHLTEDPHCI